MAEHKDTVLQDGFHRRTPPMQASRLRDAHPRTATVRNVHRGACNHGPVMLGVQGFICLTHPSLCFIKKTTKLLHGGRWENAGLAPTAKCRRSFPSWRPLSASGPRAKCSHTSLTNLGLFVCLSPYLARPRLPVALRGKTSRHTLGWRPTVAALPAGPRSASVQTGKRRGGGKYLRSVPSSSSDGCVNGPTAVWDPREHHQWVEGGSLPAAAGPTQAVAFPFMW